jgi:hypothetical protein
MDSSPLELPRSLSRGSKSLIRKAITTSLPENSVMVCSEIDVLYKMTRREY